MDYGTGAAVTLTVTPNAGSSFAGWRNDCSGLATTCVVTMETGKSVIATFDLNSIGVKKSGNGAGVVLSQPAGLNCGTSCNAYFDGHPSIILTAVPNSGSHFAGWAGPCSGTSAYCTVGTSVAQTVTATFALGNAVATPPTVPLNVALKSAPASARVSFGEPASQGSSAVIRYEVGCLASGQASATASGLASPIVVRRMIPRVAYACSVAAVNSVGAGPASPAQQVTPMPPNIESILQLLLD